MFCLLACNFHSRSACGQTTDESLVEKYYAEGQQALTEGNFTKAESIFEKLRNLAPRLAEVHANLGLIYFNERKFEGAETELRQALKLKPGLSKSETLLAMTLSELGKYREALSCFGEGI